MRQPKVYTREKSEECWRCGEFYKPYPENVDDYCKICNNKLIRNVRKSMQELKEGRTYTYSCSHYKGKGAFLCNECHVEECKKWYKIGKKDAKVKG